MGQYRFVIGGTESVEGGTESVEGGTVWYLAVLGQYWGGTGWCLVELDQWVSIGPYQLVHGGTKSF